MSAPKVTALLAATAANVLDADHSTMLDVDDDGMPDLEWAYDNRVARQTDAGFTIEPLPAASNAYRPYCRSAAGPLNAPRVIAQLRSGAGDETPYVVDLHTDAFGATTYFNACNRLGQKVGSAKLPGRWALEPTVRLVDLNRDHLPDVVSVETGVARILPNTSTASAFSFGAAKTVTLSPQVEPDSAWVHDFNGDGIPDLITRTSSELWVWLGKGNFAFETLGRSFGLRTTSGVAIVSLDAFALTFVDANRDGLTDVVLTGSTGSSTYLFVNRGTFFGEVAVAGLAAVDAFTSQPVVLSTTGSGGTELTFSRSGKGLALVLDAPETGLMAWADDGRGTVLSFEYGRAAPSPGGKHRQVVLTRMTSQASGQGPVSYEFAYGAPRLHTEGKFLLGYDQVQRTTPLGVEWARFSNEDWHASLLVDSTTRDALVPGLERYSHVATEDAVFQGVPWKRAVQTDSGWRSTEGSGVSLSESTRTTAWWGDLCPAQVVKRTSAGTLTVDTQYASPAAYAGHLACLPAQVTQTGAHLDPTLDFQHATVLTRNDVGLVTRVASAASATEVWTLQDVAYTPAWQVETISAPLQGTMTAAYDPVTRLLTRVTSPDGVVVEVVTRDVLTDTASHTRTTRGLLVHEQHFAFDGQERLQRAWDSVGSGTQANPDLLLAYRFATASTPATLWSSTLVDAGSLSVRETTELLTAAGEPAGSGRRIPEGWAVTGLTWRDPGSGETTGYVGATIAAASLAGLDYGALLSAARPLRTTTSGPFGVATSQTEWLHADVRRTVVEGLWLDGTTGWLVKNARENGMFDRTTALDASSAAVATWDEARTGWGYVRDAIGRLRGVTLADGRRHLVRYDGHGRIARVEREGIASVEYVYGSASGLLHQKRFLGLTGALRRTVTFVRDGIGRVEQEVHHDATTGASKAFRFYFDGATPERPSARTAVGLLTAVAGEGFVKRLEYREDAKLSRRTLELGGWRAVVTSPSYNESGELAGRTVSVRSGSTPIVTTSMVDGYDTSGRVASTTFSGGGAGVYAYDAEGRLAAVALPGGKVSFAFDEYTTRQVGSAQVTGAYSVSTSRRMNARALPDVDTIALGELALSRRYDYSRQRFLASATDERGSYAYEFDRAGLPTRIVEPGGQRELVSTGNVLAAGPVTYSFDDLGRMVVRGDLLLAYGADGQVASATRGDRSWTFVHDEQGQRLAKLENGVPVAAYLDEGYLDATQLVEPVRIAGQTVGVLRNGAFEAVATDGRGTVLAETDGTPRIPSPFGTRDVRPALAPALDYVGRGFDADLGLVRMGVRDYDPHVNRFTTPDPVFLENPDRCIQSAVECNLYAYARGNPAAFADPTGTHGEQHEVDVVSPWAQRSNAYLSASAASFGRGDALGGVANGANYIAAGALAGTALLVQSLVVEPANAAHEWLWRGYAKGDVRAASDGGFRLFTYFSALGLGAAEASAQRATSSAAAGAVLTDPRISGRVAAAEEASSAASAARLREFLRQSEKYGADGVRTLENGRFRFYGEVSPAETAGEMAGRRLVREWDPGSGATRTWHETLDHGGTVRQVRPETGGPKVHYMFDANGNYVGRW